MDNEEILLLKILELVILRHQVKIVEVFEKDNCFGFIFQDISLRESVEFIVNDRNIEDVLPVNYKICGKIIGDKTAFVGFCKV